MFFIGSEIFKKKKKHFEIFQMKYFRLTYLYTHCTHNRWWLVLGWVTIKEYWRIGMPDDTIRFDSQTLSLGALQNNMM